MLDVGSGSAGLGASPAPVCPKDCSSKSFTPNVVFLAEDSGGMGLCSSPLMPHRIILLLFTVISPSSF